MALDPTLTELSASAACDAVVDRLDVGGAGVLRVYDGAKPATADTAVGAQVLLAELTFSATAFGAAAVGTATANAITADASANATGTAAWARWIANGGAGATVLDCTVGAAGADINFSTVSFVAGAEVSISALTVTMPLT